MAKNNGTLDPMAPPYHRILPPYTKSLPYYNILPPFYSYVVHQQQWLFKSFPLSFSPPPSPILKEKMNSSLTPVPSGPRIPKSRLPACRRKVNKPVREGDGGGPHVFKWRSVEKKASVNVVRKRWKNRVGDYHRNLPLEAKTTTVMIKNIPNQYTRKLIIQVLDNHCKLVNKFKINGDLGFVSAYDFLYLPIDFKKRANAGFAFVNFTNSKAALRFADAFHGKTWDHFGSSKVAHISRARIQGKQALIRNCEMMDFSFGSHEDLPVWFEPARNGSGRIRSKMFTAGKCFHGRW